MSSDAPYGRTAGGKPITEDLVERLAERAEKGFEAPPPHGYRECPFCGGTKFVPGRGGILTRCTKCVEGWYPI